MAAKSSGNSRKASFHIPHNRRRSFLPGQIALKFDPDAMESGARGVRAYGVGASVPSDASEVIEWLTNNAGLDEIRTPFVDDAPEMAGRVRRAFSLRARSEPQSRQAAAVTRAVMSVAASPHEDLRGYTIAHVDPRMDVTKAIRRLQRADSVAIASPVAARWMLGSKSVSQFRLHDTPQWNLDCVGFRQVAAPRRPNTVRIAVLDTGIDLRHPDLTGVTIRYDHGRMKAGDLEGHGTHVAGIISAIAAIETGVWGVAQCDLDVWKVFSDSRIGGDRYVDPETYNRALGLVLDSGCQVVNLSLGGDVIDRFEQDLIARLIRRGVTVVAAMGNEYEDGNPIEYPAALPGVIAVGGIDQDHARAPFSNTGRHICVVAPAVAIRSTVPLSGRSLKARYEEWDGTSFAAPLVTGAIGYLMAHKRVPIDASPADVRKHLQRRAVRLPRMRGKRFSSHFGYGVIDFPRLL